MDYSKMKAGYQGKSDSMRTMSEKMLSEYNDKAPSSSKKQTTRYKEGGKVEKYAMGGSAKVRKGVSTAKGAPIKQSKCNKGKNK